MFKALTPALLALALTPAAHADEAWDSPIGAIIYQADENGAAIFSFTNVDGFPAELIIPGLAGNYDQRGVHPVLYIGSGDLICPVEMSRAGGEASSDWGTGYIAFDNPGFPTAFTLTIGDCLGDPIYSIRATAR